MNRFSSQLIKLFIICFKQLCCFTPSALYLESAEDGGHSAVQGVPAAVAFVHHGFELAGSVSAVLPGQAAVLVIDQFQLGQPLINLPLETLKTTGEDGIKRRFRVIKRAPNIVVFVNTPALVYAITCSS